MSKAEDRASEEEDTIREKTIASIRSRKYSAASSTGFCLFCTERLVDEETIEAAKDDESILDGTQRWCDAFCRDSWQKQTGAK